MPGEFTKMRKTKILALSVAGSVAMAISGVALGSGSASAATYNGVCGSGYTVIDHADIVDGTVFLTYNNGTNCVVTVRNESGQPRRMFASVSISGSSQIHQDVGNYTTYAGPVYVYAPHQCIDWGGGMVIPPAQGGNAALRPSSHCG